MKWDRPTVIIVILLAIIILLYGLRVYLVNDYIEGGVDLGNLQKEVKVLDTQNMVLEEKLLPLESLTNINERAKKDGFVSGKTYTWVEKGR